MNPDTLPDSPPNDRMQAAREKLTQAQERAREIYEETRQKVMAGARSADLTIRQRPYESIAIAFAVGALVGWLISRKNSDPYGSM